MNIGMMEHLIQAGKPHLLVHIDDVDSQGGIAGVVTDVEGLHNCLKGIHKDTFPFYDSVEDMVDSKQFILEEIEFNVPTKSFHWLG